VCQTASGVLAGSALDMATAVRNTVEMVGVPLAEAARMASTYPAAFLGLEKSFGKVTAGFRADLVALNEDYSVYETWIAGACQRCD